MELFRKHREKTVVLRLPRIIELFHRKDIVGALKRVVGLNTDSVGQLESNLRWEVVLRDISAKQKLLSSSKLPVGNYEASLEPLYYSQHRLRITCIPMCTPNEYIASLLSDRHVNVVQMSRRPCRRPADQQADPDRDYRVLGQRTGQPVVGAGWSEGHRSAVSTTVSE